MRRFATIILAAAAAFMAAAAVCPAQDTDKLIEEILQRSRTEKVTLNYSCSISKLSPVRFSGKLIIQGDCYYAEGGGGLRIYCNGSTRWTVDPDSREVYIEEAGGVEEVLPYRNELSGLKISDAKFSPQSGAAIFTFDTRTLDSSWVVTDLR